ncbi:hypothetical protein DFQ30_007752 [Apophysomyces sp. BC1015]|nr:hypothetical protein DFQ30_007752 [Apophysomyces sp. BC1015]
MTHGGRYLFVNNQEICEDNDYDMTRSPQNLESKGSEFEMDDHGQLSTTDGTKVVFVNTQKNGRKQKFGLLMEQINPEEYVIRMADRRRNHQYMTAGMECLKAQGEPDSMCVFSVKQPRADVNTEQQDVDVVHANGENEITAIKDLYAEYMQAEAAAASATVFAAAALDEDSDNDEQDEKARSGKSRGHVDDGEDEEDEDEDDDNEKEEEEEEDVPEKAITDEREDSSDDTPSATDTKEYRGTTTIATTVTNTIPVRQPLKTITTATTKVAKKATSTATTAAATASNNNNNNNNNDLVNPSTTVMVQESDEVTTLFITESSTVLLDKKKPHKSTKTTNPLPTTPLPTAQLPTTKETSLGLVESVPVHSAIETKKETATMASMTITAPERMHTSSGKRGTHYTITLSTNGTSIIGNPLNGTATAKIATKTASDSSDMETPISDTNTDTFTDDYSDVEVMSKSAPSATIKALSVAVGDHFVANGAAGPLDVGKSIVLFILSVLLASVLSFSASSFAF